jgi:hypothetical protein
MASHVCRFSSIKLLYSSFRAYSSACKFRVTTGPTGSPSCSNKSCPSFHAPSSFTGGTASDYARWDSTNDRPSTEPHFNLSVSLSDCTGELEGVWLGGQVATDLLGCSVSLQLKCGNGGHVFLLI